MGDTFFFTGLYTGASPWYDEVAVYLGLKPAEETLMASPMALHERQFSWCVQGVREAHRHAASESVQHAGDKVAGCDEVAV